MTTYVYVNVYYDDFPPIKFVDVAAFKADSINSAHAFLLLCCIKVEAISLSLNSLY